MTVGVGGQSALRDDVLLGNGKASRKGWGCRAGSTDTVVEASGANGAKAVGSCLKVDPIRSVRVSVECNVRNESIGNRCGNAGALLVWRKDVECVAGDVPAATASGPSGLGGECTAAAGGIRRRATYDEELWVDVRVRVAADARSTVARSAHISNAFGVDRKVNVMG